MNSKMYRSLSLVDVMNKMLAPSPLMLRAPSKCITQCSGQVAGMGSGVSAELDSPLDDAAIGLFVAEDVP